MAKEAYSDGNMRKTERGRQSSCVRKSVCEAYSYAKETCSYAKEAYSYAKEACSYAKEAYSYDKVPACERAFERCVRARESERESKRASVLESKWAREPGCKRARVRARERACERERERVRA